MLWSPQQPAPADSLACTWSKSCAALTRQHVKCPYLVHDAPPDSGLGADTMHKPGFKLHARILHHLFGVATSGVIKEPLWDTATTPGGSSAFPSNAAWLQQRLSQLLVHSFPNLRPQQIEVQPP